MLAYKFNAAADVYSFLDNAYGLRDAGLFCDGCAIPFRHTVTAATLPFAIRRLSW